MTPPGITTSKTGTAALRVSGARNLAVLGARVKERVVGGGRAGEGGEARLEVQGLVAGGRPIPMLGGAHRLGQMGARLGAELLVGGRLQDPQTIRGEVRQANGGRDLYSTLCNPATYLIWTRASMLFEGVVVIYR